jgi:hypothetical protein
MVEHPLIHQAVPVSRHCNLITVTLELAYALTGASDPRTHLKVFTLLCDRDTDV